MVASRGSSDRDDCEFAFGNRSAVVGKKREKGDVSSKFRLHEIFFFFKK